MSLADRIDSVRRSQQAAEAADHADHPGPVRGRERVVDPFAAVKNRVHQTLIDDLGQRLYDPHLRESELAAQVRDTLQRVIESEQTPLSQSDR
jgi:pilus assembly protein CpaF